LTREKLELEIIINESTLRKSLKIEKTLFEFGFWMIKKEIIRSKLKDKKYSIPWQMNLKKEKI